GRRHHHARAGRLLRGGCPARAARARESPAHAAALPGGHRGRVLLPEAREHVWGARADHLERPDLIVFDIDPDPALPFARVVETALALRTYLSDLGLAAFARATGGKGLHVVAPLVRRATWDEVRDFSKGVAQDLVRIAPNRFTAVMSKAQRKGKIYIDWVRNTREATAVASYSTR